MSETKIEIGDRVIFTFSPTPDGDGGTITGKVLHISQAVDDAWHVLKDDGTLIYIALYETIVREPLEKDHE